MFQGIFPTFHPRITAVLWNNARVISQLKSPWIHSFKVSLKQTQQFRSFRYKKIFKDSMQYFFRNYFKQSYRISSRVDGSVKSIKTSSGIMEFFQRSLQKLIRNFYTSSTRDYCKICFIKFSMKFFQSFPKEYTVKYSRPAQSAKVGNNIRNETILLLYTIEQNSFNEKSFYWRNWKKKIPAAEQGFCDSCDQDRIIYFSMF